MPAVDLIATIPVPPELLEQAAAMLLAYGELVRTEPGNLRFEAYVEQGTSALIVIERYADQAAFEAHLNDPANADFNGRLGELLSGGGSSLQLLDQLR